MSVDPNLPMELDDGREVHVVRDSGHPNLVILTATGSAHRRDKVYKFTKSGYYYRLDSGVFEGDFDNDFHTIRNVDNPSMYIPEDWS